MEKLCEQCGKPYTGAECLACAAASQIKLPPSLPFVSFTIAILLLAGFSVVRLSVTAYRNKERSVAASWQSRGDEALRTSRSAEAVEDFENALAYDRENSDFRLKLATALVGEGRYDEARSHLLSLWEQRPGDANVNLQLAHLDQSRGDLSSAGRFYEGAIFGVWPIGNPYTQRAEARLEYAKLLIAQHRNEESQTQLAALATELPEVSPQHKVIGDLFMRSGAPQLAYREYLRPRSNARRMPASQYLDLAQAAFAQNDFSAANHYASQAARENPPAPGASEFASRMQAILQSDPFAPGTGELERALRVIRDFQSADARMAQCFPSYVLGPNSRSMIQQSATPGQLVPQGTVSPAAQGQIANFNTWAQQLRPRMIAAKLRHEDDVQENTMRFVFQSELFAAKNCSISPAAQDSALISLSKARWSNE